MKSPNNKTQQHRTKVKNLSTLLAIGLAIVTLFQAASIEAKKAELGMSFMEAQLIAEVDAHFAEQDMTLELEEELLFEMEEEAQEEIVKVFDVDGNLMAEGAPSQNESLRKLVNQGEFMNEFGGTKYYTVQ